MFDLFKVTEKEKGRESQSGQKRELSAMLNQSLLAQQSRGGEHRWDAARMDQIITVMILEFRGQGC